MGAEEGVVCGGKTNLIADGFRLRADFDPSWKGGNTWLEAGHEDWRLKLSFYDPFFGAYPALHTT